MGGEGRGKGDGEVVVEHEEDLEHENKHKWRRVLKKHICTLSQHWRSALRGRPTHDERSLCPDPSGSTRPGGRLLTSPRVDGPSKGATRHVHNPISARMSLGGGACQAPPPSSATTTPAHSVRTLFFVRPSRAPFFPVAASCRCCGGAKGGERHKPQHEAISAATSKLPIRTQARARPPY